MDHSRSNRITNNRLFFRCNSIAGPQSYISSNGAGWSDLTVSQPNTNVCLKAYTVPVSTTTVTKLKPSITGSQKTSLYSVYQLKNLTRSSVTVKSSFPLNYLNAGTVNQTNPSTRSFIGQVSTGIHLPIIRTCTRFLCIHIPD